MELEEEAILRRGWHRLRLSVKCPERVPSWDAIIVTAASPQQARLYELQLDRLQTAGRIPQHTKLLAVPDPQGRRIGSGGATLAAIQSLARNSPIHVHDKMRLLLVHAGGDSKRVPWANAIGKAFVPLPFLSKDHPDEPGSLLLDHILAITALMEQMPPTGVVIMTGDVLPCFDASRMTFPQDGALVVTTRVPLELATNHGVIMSRQGSDHVDDLLQKPSIPQLQLKLDNGKTALLDTGIFSVTGQAWQALIGLALAESDPVKELLYTAAEMSLYEELAAAWVPARHSWLETRPLGTLLIQHLGTHSLYHYCANDLRFLHFGTSTEILQHLSRSGTDRHISRRHFTCVDKDCTLSSTCTILTSKINHGAIVGDESLVYNCTLGPQAEVGSRCVVLGVHQPQGHAMTLPDEHCLWQVPLKNDQGFVTFCCSTVDNPKVSAKQGGTFCGKSWKQVLWKLGMDGTSLWGTGSSSNDLWTAKLFPVVSTGRGLDFALWLMGESNRGEQDSMLREWHTTTRRLSLAQVQEYTDFEKMFADMNKQQAEIASRLAKASIQEGLQWRNFSKLTTEMMVYRDETRKELLQLCSNPGVLSKLGVPASRIHQVRMDLTRDDELASLHEKNAWQAVAQETAVSVAQGPPAEEGPIIHVSKTSTVRLPVRLDIVGGWSDTPPWSTERMGRVLNMAIYLDGEAPVGAEATLKTGNTGTTITRIFDDADNSCVIDDLTTVSTPFDEDDPFRLVKAALVVTGLTRKTCNIGSLDIRTWARVPRGSGLGTSSILAAAVVRALLQVTDGNASHDNVARLVLVLEQVMGTGGGWQDQVGGIYPGLKCTTSLPGCPLKFIVEPICLNPDLQYQLERRMLLVFTGQVRLARNVLQNVVKRYLQRDTLLISSINRLVELAKQGQEAFQACNLDTVGEIMLEAWDIHQELDPFCSNSFVDAMFKSIAHLTSGYKLLGAGGGGFAVILAKDCLDSPVAIKSILSTSFGQAITIHNWRLSLC